MNPLDHIRQRKVIQWAVAYLAGAWVTLQVLDFLAGQFDWPGAVVRGATVFLASAFLAVLVLAWYHGERGQQRITAVESVLLATIMLGATAAAVVFGRAGAGEPTAATAAVADGDRSIAVLPFVNMSDSKDNEYFADGITEEILNALSKIEGLRVASRTSSFQFKGQNVDIGDAAAKLGVAHMLEGSVRKDGNRVRVTAQLIKASDGFHLWSETYDRNLQDIFAVQEEIARTISNVLSVRLMGADSARLAHRGTEDVEAYTLYLRGKQVANNHTRSDLDTAMALFQRAVGRDAGFAAAHAGISDVWGRLADDFLPPQEAYPKAREAALRAIAADSLEPKGLSALAFVQIAHDWKLPEALANLDRVLHLSPNDADARANRALILEFTNRLAEAETEFDRAVLLDPLASLTNSYRTRFYLHRREWDRVIADANRILESNPRFQIAYRVLGDAHLGKQQPQQALAAYRQGLAIDSGFARLRSAEVRALAALGRMAEARTKAERLAEEGKGRYVRAEEVAQAFIALNDVERAFAWLGRAERERSAGLMFLNAWPAYEPLRRDPRFIALLERVGLPVISR